MIVDNVDVEGALSTSEIKEMVDSAFSRCNLILQHMQTYRKLQTMRKS